MITRNEYGNVDIKGGIPAGLVLLLMDKRTEMVAKRAGIDVARAINGFRREGRSWSPVIKGLLVEAANEARLKDALHADRQWSDAVGRHEREAGRAMSAELPGV